MTRAVFDANVFVSSILSGRGVPARLLDGWKAGVFELISSAAVLQEVDRVLRYPKIARRHQWPDAEIRQFIENLAQNTITTPGLLKFDVIKANPTDDRYLECAVEGRADYIVSGDRHLLQLREFRDIEILAPREFVDRLS